MTNHLIDRKKVRDEIEGCARCELRKKCKKPVPFSGVTPNRIAVMGEAPGRQEDEQGKPFVGPSGQLIKRELERAAFDVGSIAFLNTVCCYPNGTPGTRHVSACRNNRNAQLHLIQPDYLLVVGSIALGGIWKHLRIGVARGHWWDWNGINCLATWHPAAVLRDDRLRDEFVEDIWSFRIGITDGVWRDWWCAKCDHYTTIHWGLDGIGEMGIPLCAKCLVGERRKGEPMNRDMDQQQGVLL